MRTGFNVLLACLMVVPWRAGGAQSTARDSVLSTIERVFDAMRARDTTGMRALFDSTARLTFVPDSSASIRPQTVSRFLTDVSTTPADSAFDERMYDPEVRVEGPIAQVWTYYTFREGKRFSHCGSEAFTLLRAGGAWRIVNWIWMARRTGCTRTG